MSSSRCVLARALIATFLAAGVLAPMAARAVEPLTITVLSNRADLVSGNDALVAVSSPARVWLNGRDVSRAFARRADGRFEGVLTGLALGGNAVRAVSGSRGARLVITNHPSSGPVFSGPQITPWVCQPTAKNPGCDQPVGFTYLYKPIGPAQQDLKAYDPANPPPDVATTTTDQGVTVPFIVRNESGYLNRDAYTIMTLFQPGKPWTATSPQTQWNHKLFFGGGAGCGNAHTVGTPPLGDEPQGTATDAKSYQTALGRGFAVFSTALANLGHTCNMTLAAEGLMMVKEHLVDSYGTVRHTIGSGCSAGSIVQQTVANAYPGIFDGLIVACTYPDLFTALTQFTDAFQLRGYFEDPSKWGPGVAWTETQMAAVAGNASYLPTVTGATLLSDLVVSPTSDCAGVSPATRYQPATNPKGVRCGVMDFNVNVLGPRPASVWTAAEKAARRGFAGSTLDNVGVQFGLKALTSGQITPAMFVDLNERLGGVDIDFRRRAGRSQGDLGAIAAAYRSGNVNAANNLQSTPILSATGPDPGIAHDVVHSFWIRYRLDREHGSHANHVMWQGPVYGTAYTSYYTDALVAMDRWLTAVDNDKSSRTRAQKVVADRPSELRDQCKGQQGQILNEGHCPEPLEFRYSTPREVAGMHETADVLKCQLKPLNRADYAATPFTDPQWAAMKLAFPTGVCDYTKPSVAQQKTTVWLSYGSATRHVYGGTPLGAVPVSASFRVAAGGPTRAPATSGALAATGSSVSVATAGLALVLLVLLGSRTWRVSLRAS